MADADKAAWQNVEQEATQELIDGKAHGALAVAMGRVPPSKGYVAIVESQ